MSFKIPNLPTVNASISDLSDFLELMCIANGEEYSIVNGTKKIAIGSDEIDNEGVDSDDDKIYNRLQDALGEIDNRKQRSNNRYPFITTNNSIVRNPDYNNASTVYWCYLFLLFATRNNMNKDKVKQGVDGTLLFEELSALVAKEYWGDRADSFIFGTATSGSFREKIEDVISKIKEGKSYKSPEGTTNDEKDGGLDIVVWKHFADKRKSKLVGFGQCKTGTEWRQYVGLVLPDAFCGAYLAERLVLDPVKMFFTSEVCVSNYEVIARKSGLFFDRCRLMDYLPNKIAKELISRIKKWTEQSIVDFVRTM